MACRGSAVQVRLAPLISTNYIISYQKFFRNEELFYPLIQTHLINSAMIIFKIYFDQ